MLQRVVILNDISTPKGGATALALESARQFRARNIPVTLLTGDVGYNEELTALGVEIVALGGARLMSAGFGSALMNGLYNRSARAMVDDWIAQHDTPGTVYHLHGWSQILSPSIFEALGSVRSRLVISAHDFFLACPNGSFSFLKTGEVCLLRPMSLSCVTAQCDRRNYAQKLWRVARQAIQRHFYDRRNSPPVLAIHESMRPFLMRADIPSHAIVTLPNPVRPFTTERVSAEKNSEVLYVGRLEETKGPDLAASACRAAGVTLRLVGDGAMRADMERRFPEMLFMGHQPPDAIKDLARNARLLVMPSRYPEPYGLVAAEALWSGLPVIAADTAFLSADIVAAGAGLAVAPRDTVAFAAAIRTVFDSDALCERMSRAAIGKTMSVALTPDEWIDRLIAAYEARLSGADVAIAH
jgi:glycosyltransferase involved in cell wall biosynthesis